MRIAAMQARSGFLDVPRNLALVDTAAASTRASGADLLVTPELFACGYAPALLRPHLSAELTLRISEGMADISRRHGLGVVYSLPMRGDGGWHIGAVLLDRSGEELLRYRKVHLFGEEERSTFAASSAPPNAVEFDGLRLGMLICYDAEFPESVRALADAGADVVLIPTALGVGFESVPEVLLRARALENQVGVVYSNQIGRVPTEGGGSLRMGGRSIIIGPDGRVLAKAGAADQELKVITAGFSRAQIARARSTVSYGEDRRSELYASWVAEAVSSKVGPAGRG